MEDSTAYKFKVCVFGDGGVGKTTLINRYLTGVFDEDLTLTLGMDFHVKTMTVGDIKSTLQIWDFAGEREFRELLPACVIEASAAIFLYDTTRYSSLSNVREWLQIFRENNEGWQNLPTLLVGSKIDLISRRTVKIEDALVVSKQNDFSDYMECSSITGENVEKIFYTINRKILETNGLI